VLYVRRNALLRLKFPNYLHNRWAGDEPATARWTTPPAGTHAVEGPCWAHAAHNLSDAFGLKAENVRRKRRAVLHMPAFQKVRAPPLPPTPPKWVDPQVPPAIANPVQGPKFGQVVKLANVKGRRWVAGGFHNRNYHGKGVYIGRLQQDRLGNVCEFF